MGEINLQYSIAGIFIVLGFFFSLVATIGVLRLPDFFTRIHASGKNETLGLILVLLGLAIYEGLAFNSVKLVIIAILAFIFNTTGIHVLSRVAHKSGLKPWFKD